MNTLKVVDAASHIHKCLTAAVKPMNYGFLLLHFGGVSVFSFRLYFRPSSSCFLGFCSFCTMFWFSCVCVFELVYAF